MPTITYYMEKQKYY